MLSSNHLISSQLLQMPKAHDSKLHGDISVVKYEALYATFP